MFGVAVEVFWLTLNVEFNHMLGCVCIIANDARIIAGIIHRWFLRVDGLILCERIENEWRNIAGPWEGLAIFKPVNYTKNKWKQILVKAYIFVFGILTIQHRFCRNARKEISTAYRQFTISTKKKKREGGGTKIKMWDFFLQSHIKNCVCGFPRNSQLKRFFHCNSQTIRQSIWFCRPICK